MTSSPLVATRIPENVTGFGAAEVAYLLSRHDGDTIARSRDLLQAADERRDEFARMCGASSLLARGLLRMSGDGVDSVDAAALLEYAAGTATRWTVLSMATTDVRDFAIFLHTADVIAIAQPRQVGTLFVSFTDAADHAETIMKVLKAGAAAYPAGRMSLRLITAVTERDVQLALTNSMDKPWEISDSRGVERLADDTLKQAFNDLMSATAR